MHLTTPLPATVVVGGVLPGSVRVEVHFRAGVESVLHEGETLSEFVEASVRAVERRCVQEEFIARGLRARDAARRNNDYVDADVVVAGLQRKLDAARERLARNKRERASRFG